MSGGPQDKEALLREVIDADEWLVTHDGLIALSGALAGEDGIVAIAGTGSFTFGRRGDRTMRAGGWGYIFGDEGSAFWIGKEALRAALRREEGWGGETLLYPALLAATGTSNANDALHLFYGPEWPRSRVASLAVDVSKAAEAGDATAIAILTAAGENLANYVLGIYRGLWGRDSESAAIVSYIGGVFRSPRIQLTFADVLSSGAGLAVRPPVFGADAGALIEAYRLAGIHPTLREV